MRRSPEVRREARPDAARAAARPAAAGLTPWYVRASRLLREARRYAWERSPEFLAKHVPLLVGGDPAAAHPVDVERAPNDLLALPGVLPDGRSLVRAFAEEAEGLEAAERDEVRRWEGERRRGVYLVDRCHREWLEGWDPLEGRRLVIHFPEPLPAARAGEVRRGTVVTARTVPWKDRLLAQGTLEFFAADEALPTFRGEVRNAGRAWHDLPPAAPTPRR